MQFFNLSQQRAHKMSLWSFCYRDVGGDGPGVRSHLRARDFMANNAEHLDLLKKMGVSLIHLKDGRVQLVQHANQVKLLLCFCYWSLAPGWTKRSPQDAVWRCHPVLAAMLSLGFFSPECAWWIYDIKSTNPMGNDLKLNI